VLLDLLAEVGDEALARFGKQLGEGVGSDALEDGGAQCGGDDLGKERDLVLVHHAIDEGAEECGEDKAGGAVDGHEEEGAGEQRDARLDELPDFGPDVFELGRGFFLGEVGGDGATGTASGGVGWAHLGGATVQTATYAGGSVICHSGLVYAAGSGRAVRARRAAMKLRIQRMTKIWQMRAMRTCSSTA
jgi:hypothetical protein